MSDHRRRALRLIIIGCEYSGTTTLSLAIEGWARTTLGGDYWKGNSHHDHWKIPHLNNAPLLTDEERERIMADQPDTQGGDFTRTGLTEEEQKQVLALSPRLKEMFQRYHLEYHVMPEFYAKSDHCMVGAHIEEAIYAPLYFDYGGKGQKGERANFARKIERKILEIAPDTVLILVKALPEVIAKRMEQRPHLRGVLQKKDIGHVLGRFEEEYEKSLLKNKLTIDTSTATIEESLNEFVQKVQEFLTPADCLRIVVQRARQRGEWV